MTAQIICLSDYRDAKDFRIKSLPIDYGDNDFIDWENTFHCLKATVKEYLAAEASYAYYPTDQNAQRMSTMHCQLTHQMEAFDEL